MRQIPTLPSFPSVPALRASGAAPRRNILSHSQDFEAWTMAGGSMTITPGSHLGPDGTPTASTLEDNANNSAQRIVQGVFALPGQPLAASVFVRRTTGAPGHYPALQLVGDTITHRRAVLNTTTGEIAVAGSPSATLAEPIGADWWRIGIALQLDAAADVQVRLDPAYNTTGTTSGSSAAMGATVFWGAQLELSPSFSPYQRTI